MRIISSFKDYYDGGAVYGIDQNRVYVRETTFESFDKQISTFEIVGFCGEIFPIVNFSEIDWDHKWKRHPKDFILYHDDAIKYTFENDRKWRRGYGYMGGEDNYKKVQADKYVGWPHKLRRDVYNDLVNSKELKQLFVEFKVPVFFIGKYPWLEQENRADVVLNPRLEYLGFYKVLDTVQAFQRIEMFLGSTLVTEFQGQVPVGDDNVIRDSKGFDRFSFRKDPGQKKRSRRKK